MVTYKYIKKETVLRDGTGGIEQFYPRLSAVVYLKFSKVDFGHIGLSAKWFYVQLYNINT